MPMWPMDCVHENKTDRINFRKLDLSQVLFGIAYIRKNFIYPCITSSVGYQKFTEYTMGYLRLCNVNKNFTAIKIVENTFFRVTNRDFFTSLVREY